MPRGFQLEGDGLIGIDLLERLEANVNYKDFTITMGTKILDLSGVKLAQNKCLIDTSYMNDAEATSILLI